MSAGIAGAGSFGRSLTARVATAGSRAFTTDIRAAMFGFVVITAVGADNGGYYATSWGWTTMVLAWLVALEVLARPILRFSHLEAMALAGIAGLAFWSICSLEWSSSATQTGFEFERTLVYVAGLAAAIVIARSGSYMALIGGVWAGTVAISGYGLLTRLFVNDFPQESITAGNRLDAPIGYWNSLGLLAAFGCVLALGLAAHANSWLARAAAAASLPILSLTLYFTFSRGSWVALAIGAVCLIALDDQRIGLVLGLGASVPWAVAAVLIASKQQSLTGTALGAQAVSQGHHVAELTAVLCLAGAATTLPLGFAARAVSRPLVDRLVAATCLAVGLIAIGGVIATYGSPLAIATRGWHGFNAPPATVRGSLNNRLLSTSGSFRTSLWRVALDDAKHHPVFGSGGGTYESQWLLHRTVSSPVVNAHSVYLETLAELGPIGLACLLIALLAPLVSAVRARHRPFVPAAAAAYVTFLVHAGVDWDWQLPAVGLAALVVGGALLVASRPESRGFALGSRRRWAFAGLAVFVSLIAAVGLLGNRAAAQSATATLNHNWSRAAADAHHAITLMPWSSTGWEDLGEAQYQHGETAAARSSLQTAIEKDPQNWNLWLELGLASTGTDQKQAIERALALNPRSPEIASVGPAFGVKP